ncbi:hypothetical protein [Actinoallomurus acaciae]|uniref:Uncharacterized protein n=1 Tax=Actinoallomurus acaciae TaxID=502577 RepID=A0ABV5YQY7_9ACTN
MGGPGENEGAPARRPPREQFRAYLEGHRRNPLTTTLTGARFLNAFQVPWFRIAPPRGFGVLTTVGRKTGKTRRTCVRAIRDGTGAPTDEKIRAMHEKWYTDGTPVVIELSTGR